MKKHSGMREYLADAGRRQALSCPLSASSRCMRYREGLSLLVPGDTVFAPLVDMSLPSPAPRGSVALWPLRIDGGERRALSSRASLKAWLT